MSQRNSEQQGFQIVKAAALECVNVLAYSALVPYAVQDKVDETV